jgi:hypothetical protein
MIQRRLEWNKAESLPVKKSGKKAMKKTKKIETMQRLIQSNTGMRL